MDRLHAHRGWSHGDEVGVPRAKTIIENGMSVPPALGVATAINFQLTGAAKLQPPEISAPWQRSESGHEGTAR